MGTARWGRRREKEEKKKEGKVDLPTPSLTGADRPGGESKARTAAVPVRGPCLASSKRLALSRVSPSVPPSPARAQAATLPRALPLDDGSVERSANDADGAISLHASGGSMTRKRRWTTTSIFLYW